MYHDHSTFEKLIVGICNVLHYSSNCIPGIKKGRNSEVQAVCDSQVTLVDFMVAVENRICGQLSQQHM